MTLTLRFLSGLNIVFDLECFTRVDDINDRTRASRLEVFQEYSGMTPICVGRVYTFRREVVELLEVGVPSRRQGKMSTVTWRMDGGESSHDDLLLVRILERLGSLDGVLTLGADRRAPSQACDIAPHD